MDPANVFPRLPDIVEDDSALIRRGRFVSPAFMVHADAASFRIAIDGGRIASIKPGPLLLQPTAFSIRASAETWQRFWRPLPAPGWHDLLALTKEGRAEIEGNLKPFMANLQFFKDLLASPRQLAAEGGHGA